MTAAKLYNPMPSKDRRDWPILLRNREPGPREPARPTFQPQGPRLEACLPLSIVKGMEFLVRKLHKSKEPIAPLDGFELFNMLPASPAGTGYSPNDVFSVATQSNVGGWRIAPPLYDASIGTGAPEERFGRVFTCAIRRWPVIVLARRPKPPGPDGWVDDWLPVVPGKIAGHDMLAYKPAWRHLGKDPEYGFWCLDPAGGANRWVAVPERLLVKAAYFAFRSLKRVA